VTVGSSRLWRASLVAAACLAGYGTFARVLAVYVREKRLLTLEDAIRKMTSLPAARLGLADRGLL